MRKELEGIGLHLNEDWEIPIRSSNIIKLSNWDVKSISINYEKHSCGCCEGEHYCSKEISLQELFDIIVNERDRKTLKDELEKLVIIIKHKDKEINQLKKDFEILKSSIKLIKSEKHEK